MKRHEAVNAMQFKKKGNTVAHRLQGHVLRDDLKAMQAEGFYNKPAYNIPIQAAFYVENRSLTRAQEPVIETQRKTEIKRKKKRNIHIYRI